MDYVLNDTGLSVTVVFVEPENVFDVIEYKAVRIVKPQPQVLEQAG